MKHVLALQFLDAIQCRIQNFKLFLNDTLNADYEVGLYLLRFHLLDQTIEALNCFRCLGLVISLAYECFIVRIKRAHRSTSKRRRSAPKETFSAVQITTCSRTHEIYKTRTSVRTALSKNLAGVLTAGSFLVRDGFKTTVHRKERNLQSENVPTNTADVGTILLVLLNTGTTRTVVSPLNNVAQ